MPRKALSIFGTLIIMLAMIFGTVGAQGETPEETPTVTPTPTVQSGSQFFTHPIVRLLSEYFDRETEEETPTDPTETEEPTDTDPAEPTDPSVTPTPEDGTDSGLGPIGEEIAAYHEDGLGFGVLVKIYAMVQASQEACPAAPVDGDAPAEGEEACTPLTADEMVTAFQSGTGMGLLFKEYGKPALLGVGHVKQELKKMESQSTDETDVEAEVDTPKNDKSNKPVKEKPVKEKTNNGKGPNK